MNTYVQLLPFSIVLSIGHICMCQNNNNYYYYHSGQDYGFRIEQGNNGVLAICR